MIDCYMSLNLPLCHRPCARGRTARYLLDRKALSPDDIECHARLKGACPRMRLATGEHEYTHYGFRPLIAARAIDIVQPDVNWWTGSTN